MAEGQQVNKASALHILHTLTDAIRMGDTLTEDDAEDLGKIAEWIASGMRGL